MTTGASAEVLKICYMDCLHVALFLTRFGLPLRPVPAAFTPTALYRKAQGRAAHPGWLDAVLG